MRFSAKEEYALRALVELADHHGQGPISLSRVSEAQNISLAYLEQIVGPLRERGVLESTRGAHGGYTLARSPARITVGDVHALIYSILPLDALLAAFVPKVLHERFRGIRV